MIDALQYQGKIYKHLREEWQNEKEVLAIYEEGQMKLFLFNHQDYVIESIHRLRMSRGFLYADTSSVYRKRIRPIDVFWER